MNTIDYAGLQWDVRDGIRSWTPYEREYCADGDGMVRVSERARGCFKGFIVFDQMDFVGKFKTLEEALSHAANALAENYPAIHADLYFGDDDSIPA